MTMNKSLRVRKGGGGNRGVLSRAERITKLKELEKWEEGQSPLSPKSPCSEDLDEEEKSQG
jgi:small basic protein (TIGR04137 family)